MVDHAHRRLPRAPGVPGLEGVPDARLALHVPVLSGPIETSPERPAPRVRRRVLRGGLALIAALALLELALRLLGPDLPGGQTLLYHPDDRGRYDGAATLEELLQRSVMGFEPGTLWQGFVKNSRAFRTVEYGEAKPPGTFRVLVLGDSFAYSSGGVPYRSHWPELLRQLLAAERARPVEVLNLGVPAVDTAFEVRLWELEGSRLGADLVVLGFSVGSDFTDALGARRERSGLDRAARGSYLLRVVRNLSLIHI